MIWDFNVYAMPLFLSAVAAVGMIVVVAQRRSGSGRRYFMLTMAMVALWQFTYAMEISGVNAATVRFSARLAYLAIVTIPVLLMLFSLDFLGGGAFLRRRLGGLLFIVPLITLVLVWTNDSHQLFWAETTVSFERGFAGRTVTYGAWFWVHAAYSYLLMFSAAGIIFWSALQSGAFYRRQQLWLVVAWMPTFLFNIASVFELVPVLTGLDLTPFGLILTMIIMAWDLYRFRLFDIIPYAHASTIRSMSDGVIVVNAQNRIIEANPAAADLLKRPVEALHGGYIEAIFADQPETLRRYLAIDNTHTEFGISLGEGDRYFDLRISPLRDQHDDLMGRVFVLRDVSSRVRIEAMIREYAAELERRNAELDAFGHTIAHDLRTPLNQVIGYANLLELEDGISPDGQQYAHAILDSALSMNTMIGGLLLLAQLRETSQVLGAVALGTVTQTVVARLQDKIDGRGIRLSVAAGMPVVQGYAPWLEAVLGNLLENAIKYIGAENDAPAITIRARQDGDSVRCEVEDNGVGISPNKYDKLFLAFSRLHQGEASGLGLGLSIVHRIITRLGGEVGVEPAPERGSIFWFTLPAAEGEDRG